MNNELIIGLTSGLVGSIIGSFASYILGVRAERAQRLQQTRMEKYLEAYNCLTMSNRQLPPNSVPWSLEEQISQNENFRKGVNLISIFGTKEQILELEKQVTLDAEGKPYDFMPLLVSLRDQLRVELGETSIKEIPWFWAERRHRIKDGDKK